MSGHIGIVVRADGTVPFDHETNPHDDPHQAAARRAAQDLVRAQIIAGLIDRGFTVDRVPGTKHMRIRDWNAAEHAHRLGAPVEMEGQAHAVDTEAVQGAAQPQPDASTGEDSQ